MNEVFCQRNKSEFVSFCRVTFQKKRSTRGANFSMAERSGFTAAIGILFSQQISVSF
jgi:hypothetical protein